MEKPNISRTQKIDLYNALVSSNPDVTRKGDTIPYTSVNGHMFSFLTKDDVVGLRLPAGERVKFLEKYQTKLIEQYGVVQKEYVAVPDELLLKTEELKTYFDISFVYTSSLKPKPTSKTKKKD
jgi:hypothetical protein